MVRAFYRLGIIALAMVSISCSVMAAQSPIKQAGASNPYIKVIHDTVAFVASNKTRIKSRADYANLFLEQYFKSLDAELKDQSGSEKSPEMVLYRLENYRSILLTKRALKAGTEWRPKLDLTTDIICSLLIRQGTGQSEGNILNILAQFPSLVRNGLIEMQMIKNEDTFKLDSTFTSNMGDMYNVNDPKAPKEVLMNRLVCFLISYYAAEKDLEPELQDGAAVDGGRTYIEKYMGPNLARVGIKLPEVIKTVYKNITELGIVSVYKAEKAKLDSQWNR